MNNRPKPSMTMVNYSNREILKSIGQLPVEYRPIFKKVYDYFNKKELELLCEIEELKKKLEELE